MMQQDDSYAYTQAYSHTHAHAAVSSTKMVVSIVTVTDLRRSHRIRTDSSFLFLNKDQICQNFTSSCDLVHVFIPVPDVDDFLIVHRY